MKRGIYGFIASASLAGLLYATASSPSWWKSRGVMPAEYDETSEASIDENYEAAKIGQLMNMAAKAAEELNAKLSGGAGDDINNLVASFPEYDPNDPDENYQALTAGQLKAVAELFYDRLAQLPATYVNYPEGMSPLVASQADIASSAPASNLVEGERVVLYPWSTLSESPTEQEYAENEAIVNVGQLKNVFAWSLTSVVGDDSDGDGLPDSWEMKYFGDLATANGTSCYNGDGVSDLQKYQQGKDPTLPPEGSDLYLLVYTPLE